ncbi:MAG TPA: SRPBCC family protein [Luteitalea sp.]|nr:SRPBCC family protein [Luteitalea sp.]
MTATSSLVLSMSGGRLVARRTLVRLVLCGLIGAGIATAAAAQPGEPTITVQERAGVYEVGATFTVDRPARRVLDVLTDYEGIPRLVPDVKRSVVHSRTTDHAIVEQEAVSRVLFFSKTVHLRLDIQEGADAIAFRDVCGRSFVVYEGRWQVSSRGAGTQVTYALRAQPAFEVPEFLVKRLMKRDAGQMIARLRQAMLD